VIANTCQVSKIKKAFDEKDDTNLPTEQDQNSVRETPTLGQSFLICVFPIFFST